MSKVCDERDSYDCEVSMKTCDVKVKALTVMEVLNAGEGKYLIPLYQRNYKWGYSEISQLVRDLWNNRNEGAYYLGSLVVTQRKDGNKFEVVDGQQRLTTLTLLYYRFGLLHKNPLSFENRQDAMDALTYIFNGEESFLFKDDKKGLFESFANALNFIDDVCIDLSIGIKENGKISVKDGGAFLENVKLFQVVLPQHTDVSAYFEVMNNRGRQLEAHEILKARMMAAYGDTPANVDKKCNPGETNVLHTPCQNSTDFAKCWDACKGEDPECSGVVFANRVIKDVEGGFIEGRPKENGWEARITFPQLLLIALRCYCDKDNASITTETSEQKLLDTFNKSFVYTKESVQKFILTLVQVREDFDSNIIRSFALEDGRNKWGISPGWLSNQKEMAVDSPDEDEIEVTTTDDKLRDQKRLLRQELIMLQSLLEVSGKQTWVADFLYKRYLQRKSQDKQVDAVVANIAILKKIIMADNTVQTLVAKNGEYEVPADLRYGGLASRLVLNVVDFLFWKKWKDGKEDGMAQDKDFVFRYRNSIEHFYPQDDTYVPPEDMWHDGTKTTKDAALHDIGNLYLVTSKQNSKLSNYPPKEKIQYWIENEREMTPKQRRMYYTEEGKTRQEWTADDCQRHAQKCWTLLCEFLNESPDNGVSKSIETPKVSCPHEAEDGEQAGELVPDESSSLASNWCEAYGVDASTAQWWAKVYTSLKEVLGDTVSVYKEMDYFEPGKFDGPAKSPWVELRLMHVTGCDLKKPEEERGLIVNLCADWRVHVSPASIAEDIRNSALLSDKERDAYWIPLDNNGQDDSRVWQDDELEELVNVLKSETVEEILRGLRKRPESGGAPAQA